MNIKLSYTYVRNDVAVAAAGNYCSRHHILPYHMMFFFGILCLALIKQKKDDDKFDYKEPFRGLLANNAGSLDGALDVVLVDGFHYMFPSASARPVAGVIQSGLPTSFGSVLNEISWLPYNLFLGPKGIYRTSDPRQRVEADRPASFPKERWEKLMALSKAFAAVGKHTGAEKGDRVSYEVGYSVAAALAQMFLGEVKRSAETHATLLSDWSLTPDGGGADLPLVVSLANKADFDKKFRESAVACKFKCASTVAQGKYLKVVRVAGGKVFAVPLNGSPSAEQEKMEFHPFFTTYNENN